MSWALPVEPEELLELALEYPYEAPDTSYLLEAGALKPLTTAALALCLGRYPVVAHGSNRAPAQLLRKFGTAATIPVTYGWLSGYDVVFGAHVSRYGAITSTLHAASGCQVRVAVTWLSRQQLARMHETERLNYTYGRLPAATFLPEAGPRPASLAAYLGNRGALLLDGRPVAIEGLEAEGRPHPAMSQRALQRRLAERFEPGRPLAEVVLERIARAEVRSAFTLALPASGPESLDAFEPLQRLDELPV